MYDVVHLDAESKEKLEEMLEHIIELDDIKNGWVKTDVSMTQRGLEEEFYHFLGDRVQNGLGLV